MSDPDNRLSNFDPGLPMNPLPPSDVRRQGDRLRRRNTIVAGVGAAVAVALIATPIAALSGGDEAPEPAPDTDLATEWVQTIPAEFPLDDMMGGEGSAIPAQVSDQEPYGEIVISAADICGTQVWSAEDAADLLGAVWSNGVEGGEQRTLAVYADGPEAEAVVGSIEEELGGGCSLGSQRMSTGVTPLFSEGTLGWVETFVRQGQPAGARVWQLTLVGNALLLDHMFVAQAGAADQAASDLADRAAGVVDAMCVFSAEGCETPLPPPAEPVSVEIPDDFPLAQGWPDPGGDGAITGPDRDQEALQRLVCDELAPDPAYADRLSAVYSAPEDYRIRQLTTYADADAAVAAVADIVGAYQACPREAVDEVGYVTNYELQQLDIGGESWAILAKDTMEGGETPFGSTTIIVRVGRAVLLLEHGGHAGYPGGDAQDSIEATLAQAAVPIAEMCLFTDAGC